MRSPDTLPTDAVDRAIGTRRRSDRGWRPIEEDPSELVEIHHDLRGGGYAALARIIASPIAQAYAATRADEIIVDGLGRILREVEYRTWLDAEEEGRDDG